MKALLLSCGVLVLLSGCASGRYWSESPMKLMYTGVYSINTSCPKGTLPNLKVRQDYGQDAMVRVFSSSGIFEPGQEKNYTIETNDGKKHRFCDKP